MFLVPRITKIQNLKYYPNGSIDNINSDEYESQQQEALIFMKQIFQYDNLTFEEAFSPDCYHLLNLINVLFPCGFNEIIKTSNIQKLVEENLKEYLTQLKSIKYRVENFPKEEYIQSDKVGIKKIVSTILHLKSEYEQNGIQRKEQDESRVFYVEHKSLDNLKSTQTHGINPFLTNQKNYKKYQSAKKTKMRNIFYLKEKSQWNFLKKRSEQLGYPLTDDDSDSSESESESENESEGESEGDSGSESESGTESESEDKFGFGSMLNSESESGDSISVEEKKERKSGSSDSRSSSSGGSESNSSGEEEWANQSFSDPSISDFSLSNDENDKDFLNESNGDDESISDSSNPRSSDFDFSWLTNNKTNEKKKTSSKDKDDWPSFGINNNNKKKADKTKSKSNGRYSNKSKRRKKGETSDEFDSSDSFDSYNSSISENSYDSSDSLDSSDHGSKFQNKNVKRNKEKERQRKREQQKQRQRQRQRGQQKQRQKQREQQRQKQRQQQKQRQREKQRQTKRSEQNRRNKPLNTAKNNRNKNLKKNNINTKYPKTQPNKYNKRKPQNKKPNPIPNQRNFKRIPFPINQKNHFIKCDIKQIFKPMLNRNLKSNKTTKDPRKIAFLHLIFHAINTLHKWRSNDQISSQNFSDKYSYTNIYKTCIKANKAALNFRRKGSVLFDIKVAKNFSTKFHPGQLELTTGKLILSLNKHQKKIITKQNLNNYQIQLSIQSKTLKTINLKPLRSNSTTSYSINFTYTKDVILAIMTLGHFFIASNSPKNSNNNNKQTNRNNNRQANRNNNKQTARNNNKQANRNNNRQANRNNNKQTNRNNNKQPNRNNKQANRNNNKQTSRNNNKQTSRNNNKQTNRNNNKQTTRNNNKQKNRNNNQQKNRNNQKKNNTKQLPTKKSKPSQRHKQGKNGNNKDNQKSKRNDYYSNLEIPPLAAPNKKFLNKMSSIENVDFDDNPQEILNGYLRNGGVNFLCAILNNSKKGALPGFIKIRKSKIMVGFEKSTVFKIPYSSMPNVIKHKDNDSIFLVEWTKKSTCSATSQPIVKFICSRTLERSLITHTMKYFIKNWKQNQN
ncbi:protein casc3 [Anaeramoeba flamelloides]|uniref:Protein casc3 n=1 Tax=Anaeramoeba flamelloides TaxID=1746091 RepID=A0ABQ8Y0U3_9EUKA|nr:protein casc3 [Anaeramoeba flamelloides]